MNGIMTVEATISNLNPKAAKRGIPILALSKSDIPCRIACETRYTLPRPLPRTARNHLQIRLTGIVPGRR